MDRGLLLRLTLCDARNWEFAGADELTAVILSTFGQAIADWNEDEKAKFEIELRNAVKSEAKTFKRAGRTPLDSGTDHVGMPMIAVIAVATK